MKSFPIELEFLEVVFQGSCFSFLASILINLFLLIIIFG
uniref:Uncharacterized protein n=1 Tax=Rhizophora mucronata TaxID=61149 RepID=A0A2P2QWC8_RHIMU